MEQQHALQRLDGDHRVVGQRSVLFWEARRRFCYGPADKKIAGTPADGGVDRWCYDPTDGLGARVSLRVPGMGLRRE